ncbi:hypothetical protein PI125_g25818 [Phytophthora idaei]|nr:hypothetical protein PI125_g25818 [Phytophthora idaei]
MRQRSNAALDTLTRCQQVPGPFLVLSFDSVANLTPIAMRTAMRRYQQLSLALFIKNEDHKLAVFAIPYRKMAAAAAPRAAALLIVSTAESVLNQC